MSTIHAASKRSENSSDRLDSQEYENGRVLDTHVCHHEDRERNEIQVRSLFQDKTAACVRIVNGVERYATETTETIEDEGHRVLGNSVAAARPRMKSTITLTPVSGPLHERKWMDVNPGSYDR